MSIAGRLIIFSLFAWWMAVIIYALLLETAAARIRRQLRAVPKRQPIHSIRREILQKLVNRFKHFHR